MEHVIDDSDRLKPCPFCGGTAEMHQAHAQEGPNAQGYYVECGKCGASTNLRFSCGEDARPLLMEQWNKRTKDAEAAKSERRAITFGDIVDRQVIAMRAAVVAAKLDGLDVGMQWIANTLCGPGHLPDLDDAKALGGAQALFDKEMAEHEAFRAAHPAP